MRTPSAHARRAAEAEPRGCGRDRSAASGLRVRRCVRGCIQCGGGGDGRIHLERSRQILRRSCGAARTRARTILARAVRVPNSLGEFIERALVGQYCVCLRRERERELNVSDDYDGEEEGAKQLEEDAPVRPAEARSKCKTRATQPPLEARCKLLQPSAIVGVVAASDAADASDAAAAKSGPELRATLMRRTRRNRATSNRQ